MNDAVRVSALVQADDGYWNSVSPHYDEILHEVTDRVAASGSIGKVDIGALVLWKRMSASTRWASGLNVLPEVDVRKVTGVAVGLRVTRRYRQRRLRLGPGEHHSLTWVS